MARDDSFTNIAHQANRATDNKRLASAPPENVNTNTTSQRRSRYDANTNSSHEHIPSLTTDSSKSDFTVNSAAASTANSKNRFFSLSRRFRFRTQSPEKNPPVATVHFLDEDIDLETKEPRARRSDQHSSNRPSKGILKTLRHRSPFRFRSKDAVIVEQDTSPPPPPPPVVKEPKHRNPPPPPASTAQPKQRGRLVELKKSTTKTATSNGTARKLVNVTPITETGASSLVRRTSGLKDLIHRFEATPAKPKRVAVDNLSDTQPDEPTPTTDEPSQAAANKGQAIDIPDLLQNVEKDATTNLNKSLLRHSNSSRQTSSFDSSTSMISANESISTTTSGTRKPTSTARPLMLSVVSSLLTRDHLLSTLSRLEQRGITLRSSSISVMFFFHSLVLILFARF